MDKKKNARRPASVNQLDNDKNEDEEYDDEDEDDNTTPADWIEEL